MQEIALWPVTTWCSTHRAGTEGRQSNLGNTSKEETARTKIGEWLVTKHKESGILANTVWYKNLNSNVHISVLFQK